MKMRRFELAQLIAAVAAALMVSGASFARPPFGHDGPPRDPGAFIEDHAEALDLDDETRDAIRKIVERSREQGDRLHADLRGLHEQMRDLLEQSEPDEAEVMRKVDAIGEAETAMHRYRLATMLEIRALLTPEQREAMTQLREESRGRWKRALLEECEADLAALCPGVEDRWERKECLREKRDQVSAECREAIRDARRAHHGFHEGCKHHGSKCKHCGADCPMHRGSECKHCGADCPMHRGSGSPEQSEGGSSEPAEVGESL